MTIRIKPIESNAEGFYVTLLQKALAATGISISSKEVYLGKAGTDTLKKVRTLQKKLKVDFDDSVLIDDATATAFIKFMDAKGLTSSSRLFSVSGVVKKTSRVNRSTPVKRQKLIAFDLDLRGVSAYRTVKTLDEIKKNKGIEILGEAISNNKGEYQVSFYDWQYTRLERGIANVVVYAVEDNTIVGISRLLNTEDYSNNFVHDLDVFVTSTEEITEYDSIKRPLDIFLNKNKTTLLKISDSIEQISFCANELELEQSKVRIYSEAELIVVEERELNHELLYAIARQEISLTWHVFFKKPSEELKQAITDSIKDNIISEISSEVINEFINEIQRVSIQHILDDKEKVTDEDISILSILSISLTESEQRVSFLEALGDYKGDDFNEFWNKELPQKEAFKNKPELISGLLLTQKLSALTNNHQPMIKKLQTDLGITSVDELLDFNKNKWLDVINEVGVPNTIEGKDDNEKIEYYANSLESTLNAAFATRRVSKMLAENKIKISDSKVKNSVVRFLKNNPNFDFGVSRIHKYSVEINESAIENSDDVSVELKRIQRVFQINNRSDIMSVLLEHNLDSAHIISNIPLNSFTNKYSKLLGSKKVAFAVHQRASYISTRAEINFLHLKEYHADSTMPASIMSKREVENTQLFLKNELPNYQNIFGGVDICECQHCRSVFSPAAYFVELLQFLKNCEAPSTVTSKNPLEMISLRRPDLVKLPLTCENSNTLIPYGDLSREVMESYVENDSLESFVGGDTGDATVSELRANPQYYNVEAYRILSEAKFPFSLPFHQPLHAIRTYSTHQNLSRYEVMQAMYSIPNDSDLKAVSAESLELSEGEYRLLTGESFMGPLETTEITPVHELFGFNESMSISVNEWLIELTHVRVFMNQTGVKYTELVELIKTQFINPHLSLLRFIEKIFSYSSVKNQEIYDWLKNAHAEVTSPAGDKVIISAISDYNKAENKELSLKEMIVWAQGNFDKLKSIVTLYSPKSVCDLDVTEIRTLQKIYEKSEEVDISENLSLYHSFVRLLKKTSWSIHELDLILVSIGHSEINTDTVREIEFILKLQRQSKRPLNQLAVIWGNIDTYENYSLYKALFLNKSVQQISPEFRADKWGDYFSETIGHEGGSNAITLIMHASAICAAFRIREEELNAIINVSKVIDVDVRPLNLNVDVLNVENLSTIYRHVVLAKSLKISVMDMCKIIELTKSEIFSVWDIHNKKYKVISSVNTYEFYQLASSLQEYNFKPDTLHYIISGKVLSDSSTGLNKDKAVEAAKNIRNRLIEIENTHTFPPDVDVTKELLIQKLSLSFNSDIVIKLMNVLEGVESFAVKISTGLGVSIKPELKSKYHYSTSTGRLSCTGNMTIQEKEQLVDENSSIPELVAAVSVLFSDPNNFITDKFSEFLNNSSDNNEILLDARLTPGDNSLYPKYEYCYQQYLPFLNNKFQKESVPRFISDLIGLDENVTTILIKDELNDFINTVLSDNFLENINEFVETLMLYHRSAEFVLGFGLNDSEVSHLISHNSNFDGINFTKLTLTHWQRVRDYLALRKSSPQLQVFITDVFSLANRGLQLSSAKEIRQHLDLVIEDLCSATTWNKDDVTFLVEYFNFLIDDFKNEIAINQLRAVMVVVSKTGFSAKTIEKWGAYKSSFKEFRETAQLIKNTVKAKYNDENWLSLAGNMSDDLREKQNQALIEYLLVHPRIQAENIVDADGLYEHFLIDVQMGACMDTSRIVQASAAIQLFVNRIVLNLEKDISPTAIDSKRWDWMKNYRLWEVQRKLLIYTENTLEPEWRNNRSEIFKELESHLVQTDINENSIEEGLRRYLMSLDEVSNLDVCGMHQENFDNENKLKFLHVFACTHHLPYKYYYRHWNKFEKWSAWEKVTANIQSVEDGSDSGVALIPVVWKGKLYLFWPEFMEKIVPVNMSSQSLDNMAKNENISLSRLVPKKHWEIRLAWSEYDDGLWSSKKVSNKFIRTYDTSSLLDERHFKIIYRIHEDNDLSIIIKYDDVFKEFTFSSIQSPLSVGLATTRDHTSIKEGYSYYYSKFEKLNSRLSFTNGTYFKKQFDHSLLFSDSQINVSPHQNYFFSDGRRTYFVKPYGHGYVRDALNERKESDPGLQMISSFMSIGEDGSSDNLIVNTTNVSIFPTTVGVYYDPDIKIQNPGNGKQRVEKFEFHTFYHPFTSELIYRLNSNGLADLFKRNIEPSPDDSENSESSFNKRYKPNFTFGLVKARWLFDKHPYPRTTYKENICFDIYGANSIYNWELFFHAPLYVATRLSKNGQHAAAMKYFHYIFDPTTNEDVDEENITARFWKVLPFKIDATQSIEDLLRELAGNIEEENNPLNMVISELRENPSDPHLIASNRPIAYMKHVVIKYVENLIAWGDSLFRQFSRESVYEAIQLYVIASHVLGPRPEMVPKRGNIKVETYDSLKDRLDSFSNVLVELENIMPYSSDVYVDDNSAGSNLTGVGSALYFCIPPNEKLLEYWDTVADRLFKIRHCQDLEGVERKLALFSPPIDSYTFLQTSSLGLSVGDVLSNLNSPAPIYRFAYMQQKANELCNDVKSLGWALLSAMEKKDGEELSRLRSTQEINMLDLVTGIRERQVLLSKNSLGNLLQTRETAVFRFKHYNALIGNSSATIPDTAIIDSNISINTPLPKDTDVPEIEAEVDMELVGSYVSGVKIIPMEKFASTQQLDSLDDLKKAEDLHNQASTVAMFPNLEINLEPFGTGTSSSFGSSNLVSWLNAAAQNNQNKSSIKNLRGNIASNNASLIRRTHDWTHQTNLIAKEITNIDSQLISAQIHIQVAEKELEIHLKQIANAKETELFLKNKFSNQELYLWMQEQLYSVYKQSYNLAFEMAKKAEQAYQYEMGLETSNIIQYGYWDSSKEGLLAGEKLQLGLRQLDTAYMDSNRRELELNKNISLALVDPLSLIELRETGTCTLSLTEELFDFDFLGHYFRRIKAVSLSIPCIAGPYTAVNCTLRLVKNSVRVNTSLNAEGDYPHNNDEGVFSDDTRFRASNVPVTSIATSTGQNDTGLFEFNFGDVRCLPFEGAGAISEWKIELATEKELRQFDYSSITDVIVNLKYTARENGGLFKTKAKDHLLAFLQNNEELDTQPLMNMFSMKSEFPSEWHKFLHPENEGDDQVLRFTLGKERFPFFVQESTVEVMSIELLSRCIMDNSNDYVSRLSQKDSESSDILMTDAGIYGDLKVATIGVDDEDLTLNDFDISSEINIKIRKLSASDFKSLSTLPADEVEDLFVVIHYRLKLISNKQG